jgi:methylthioribose-1-phosphate isomerase
VAEVQLCPDGSGALNYAFDVTPARLITALVTERGVCPAAEHALAALFPELARPAPAPAP